MFPTTALKPSQPRYLCPLVKVRLREVLRTANQVIPERPVVMLSKGMQPRRQLSEYSHSAEDQTQGLVCAEHHSQHKSTLPSAVCSAWLFHSKLELWLGVATALEQRVRWAQRLLPFVLKAFGLC